MGECIAQASPSRADLRLPTSSCAFFLSVGAAVLYQCVFFVPCTCLQTSLDRGIC